MNFVFYSYRDGKRFYAVMMFTTLVSSRGHYRKKSVRWDILKPMIPGIVLGSIGGSLLASHIPSKGLQYVFVVFAYGVSLKTLVGFNYPDLN